MNEQYVTEFFRGVEADEGVGERAPDHRLEADGDPTAAITYRVAEDRTARYAAASGDDFAIHLDDEFARGRSSGPYRARALHDGVCGAGRSSRRRA